MPVLCLWKPPSSPPDRTFQLQWTTCIGNARSSSTSLVRFHAKEMEKNLSVKMDKLETRPSGDGDEGGKRHDCEGNEECRGSVVKKLRALPLRTQPPTCQAEKCNADLTSAKDYHRRHKVCEVHFKAPSVLVGGLEQRFCQQCSRLRLTERKCALATAFFNPVTLRKKRVLKSVCFIMMLLNQFLRGRGPMGAAKLLFSRKFGVPWR